MGTAANGIVYKLKTFHHIVFNP